MASQSLLATVWLLTEQGRELAGHASAERAWREKEASPPYSDSRGRWFNPVEITISPDDVPAAVTKWEAIAGIPGVCHVEVREPRPGDRRNEFYP